MTSEWHSDIVEYHLKELIETFEDDPAGIEPADIIEGLENVLLEYKAIHG